MQNKGLIKTFAILFGLVSLYSISFSVSTNSVEKKAVEYAESKVTDIKDGKSIAEFEKAYIDSVANDTNLYFNLFSYNQIKEKALNLGLDLKGGINATLQVSVKDILRGLANETENKIFTQAIADAVVAQKQDNRPFLTIFFDKFDAIKGDVKLSDADIFGNITMRDKIDRKTSESDVKAIISDEVDASIATAFRVIRTRIDQFGVTQPKIQRIGKSGRISIELPGAKDISRIEDLLQKTAELQFWEAFSGQDMAAFMQKANPIVTELLASQKPKKAEEQEEVEKDSLLGDNNLLDTPIDIPANLYMLTGFSGAKSSVVGTVAISDTAQVAELLMHNTPIAKKLRALLPSKQKHVKFMWESKQNEGSETINFYAIKGNRKDNAPIQGDVISTASQQFTMTGEANVSMSMKSDAKKKWAKMTTANVGKHVAVVLDNLVYSAPVVNEPITGGSTSISGNFTLTEATDLANVLKAGKLPVGAHIVQSEIVGASLGEEAIHKSIVSFGFALLLVLLWMIFYYGKAGAFSDIALLVNILFIAGIMTAFGFVLTLPGIAGIILTIGMSVDANVIIFERIKEELAKGKKTKQAIADGFSFKGALSAIIDANITTLLTGSILFMFGTGPVKGFAITLIIGILTSLFTAIFITRLLIDWYTNRGGDLTFNTNITKGWFQNLNVDFLKKRKIAYMFSGIFIIVGLVSLFTNGLNSGVDFVGGRSYIVAFDQAPNSEEIKATLKTAFDNNTPEVKTYGSNQKLKITTKFRIDEEGQSVDNEVKQTLFEGLKPHLPKDMDFKSFIGGFSNQKYGIQHAIKVEPTIADDIKTNALWAIFASLLVVFLYILFRFKKWQYSLGAVAAVFHDVLIVLAIFSLFWRVLPFDMEIGQSFIAAILTVVGYSLNDTVVIFDRIREFANTHTKWNFDRVVNTGLSSTLGRTINTSATTLVVLLAIFLFGGDSIAGFMFALIVGVVVGTYSSLFIASPIMYDTIAKTTTKKED